MARKVIWERIEAQVREDVRNGAQPADIRRKYGFSSTAAARKACERAGFKFGTPSVRKLTPTLRRAIAREARRRGFKTAAAMSEQILAVVAHDKLFDAVLGEFQGGA